MKKIVATWIAIVGLMLGSCANLQTAWTVITTASVSPTQIIIAGNSFDAAEASATQYLAACKAGAIPATACALSTRQKVVAAVRAGRSARNGLEPYVVSGTAGPSALYNTMITSINTLNTNLPPTGAPK
jgi:hypothetical protein